MNMPRITAALLALACLQAPAQPAAAEDPAQAALKAVAELARINGQALACQHAGVARRAKALMLAHAPKTARFGSTYEDGTQQAFLAQTREGSCPGAALLDTQLDTLQPQLRRVLPVAGS